MTPMPHPWRDLADLPHVSLGWHELPREKMGVYYDDIKTVLIRPGLLQVERRCTLAHELAHYRLGHTACHDRRSGERQELQAEVLAGRFLIPLDRLVEARLVSSYVEEIADELWVDVPMLVTFEREGLTRAERQLVQDRLRAGQEWGAA